MKVADDLGAGEAENGLNAWVLRAGGALGIMHRVGTTEGMHVGLPLVIHQFSGECPLKSKLMGYNK